MTSVSLAVGVDLICALLSALGTNLSFLIKVRRLAFERPTARQLVDRPRVRRSRARSLPEAVHVVERRP